MDDRAEGRGQQSARADSTPTERGSAATDQAMETVAEGSDDVLTLVCFKCGTEYYFSEGSQPAEMSCGKCGNTVFRTFVSSTDERDNEDYEEATRRDLRTDDPEGDAMPGDLLDLDRV